MATSPARRPARTHAAPLALALLGLAPAALGGQHPAERATPEPGAARTRIVVDSVDLTGVTTLGELLQARAPGLVVQSTSGLPGAGTRLAARGRRSYYAPDEPLLVVDGLRVVGGTRVAPGDSTLATSRYDDLPVEEIAAVDVLPGAAAAARYGPGAAAGAIVVTTRRANPTPGRAGTERRAYAEAGAAGAAGRGPTFYQGVGRFTTGVEGPGCTIDYQVAHLCTLTRIDANRPYAAAPWRTAPRGRAGARLAGGGERVHYTLGADGARLAGALAGSDLTRGTLRASADLQPARALRVTVGATALAQSLDAPPGGLTPFVDFESAGNATAFLSPAATRADGTVHTTRVDLNGSAAWDARPWLHARAAVGTSGARQRDRSTLAYDPGAGGSIVREGRGTARDRVTVAELGASADYRLAGAALTTSLTAQRIGDRRRTQIERGTGRVDGDRTFQPFSSEARWRRADVRGLLAGQRLTLGPLAAGGVARFDVIGDSHARAGSGSADAALRVWSRGPRRVDLRGAVGTAVGGPADGLPFLFVFVPLGTGPYGNLVGGARPATAPSLPRSERTREAQAGVDATLGPALRAGVTYYDQNTRDVLVPGPPAFGSAGYGAAVGVGTASVRNAGVEASVRTRLVERPGLGATLGLRAWANRNRVADATAPTGIAVSTAGSPPQAVRDGVPLGAYYGRSARVAARDYNGDGVVTSHELFLAEHQLAVDLASSDGALGSAAPTRAVAADLRARVGARLTLAALAEHQGGQYVPGGAAALFNAARALVDPTMLVEEQARAERARAFPEARLERASFVRLRELSVGWRLGRAAAGRGPTLTVAGRNLLTSTSYTGLDPETGTAAATPFAGAQLTPYYAVPAARTVAVRLGGAW